MKVAIIGAGYVGLTTGACLANLGHVVTCIDVDKSRIAALRRGDVPIYEPGLADLVRLEIDLGRLHFSDQLSMPVAGADIVMLAVGTPSLANGEIDLSFIDGAAREAARHLQARAVVAVKSTVVPGTARRLAALMARAAGRPVAIASNPEFLREGSAITDFFRADRIVIGADESRPAEILAELYRPLTETGVPLVMTTTVSAEMVKYASNAFLALKIGFINDIADLCTAAGGDVVAVAQGVGLDRRIGTAFLAPGPGFGGSCFPKDTRALSAIGRQLGAPQALVEELIEDNDRRKNNIASRIITCLGQRPRGRRVAILGCAFKANTDDVREAAVLAVVPALVEQGVEVRLHDPKPPPFGVYELDGATWHASPYAAAEGADAIVILTEWEEYRRLDLRRLALRSAARLMIDYRNLFDPEAAAAAGLDYHSLGRPAARQQGNDAAGQLAGQRIMASPP